MPEIAGWVVLGLFSAFGAALVAIFGKIGLAGLSGAGCWLAYLLTVSKVVGAALMVPARS